MLQNKLQFSTSHLTITAERIKNIQLIEKYFT